MSGLFSELSHDVIMFVSVCGETVKVFFLCRIFLHYIGVEVHVCAKIITLLIVQYMDMTFMIFVDLNTSRCVYIQMSPTF